MTEPTLDLVVLISGRGSNLAALQRASSDGRMAARIAAVIADRPDAGGLALAESLQIPAHLVSYRDYASRSAFDAALAARIDACLGSSPRHLIVLAGFMRILEPPFVNRYLGRMINIHPSLLPAYRGLDTYRRALADGARWHGSSVHYVTAELDGGPVIAQVRVAVRAGDTPATLSARVQRAEHRLYWRVIDWVARRRLRLEPDGISLDGRRLQQPVQWQLPEPDTDGELIDVAS